MENQDTRGGEGAKTNRVLSLCLQELLTCPICKDYFSDPVTKESGDTFCRNCLPPQSQPSNVCTNWKIQSMVRVAKELKLCLEQPQALLEGWCPEHREPLDFFCREDNEKICIVCTFSNLHQGHTLTRLQGLHPHQEAAALDPQ